MCPVSIPIEVKSRNSLSDSLILASHAMISVFFELSMAILEATSLCKFTGFFSILGGCCCWPGPAGVDGCSPLPPPAWSPKAVDWRRPISPAVASCLMKHGW